MKVGGVFSSNFFDREKKEICSASEDLASPFPTFLPCVMSVSQVFHPTELLFVLGHLLLEKVLYQTSC